MFFSSLPESGESLARCLKSQASLRGRFQDVPLRFAGAFADIKDLLIKRGIEGFVLVLFEMNAQTTPREFLEHGNRIAAAVEGERVDEPLLARSPERSDVLVRGGERFLERRDRLARRQAKPGLYMLHGSVRACTRMVIPLALCLGWNTEFETAATF